MQQLYIHKSTGPASTDQIAIQLYSKSKLTEDIRANLTQHFTSKLPKLHGNRLLIIGAKVGVMAKLLEPYCSHMDVIGQAQYIPLLEATLVKGQAVEYTFNRQGEIGQQHHTKKFPHENCTISVIDISKFHQHIKRDTHYNIILLQNVIVHPQINILKQLMRLRHDVLITMIVPGKLVHRNLFELLCGIEENILHVFYEQATHERVEYTRYVTGRRKEINVWEIFVWVKREALDLKGEYGKVEGILQDLVNKNFVKAQQIKGAQGMAVYQTQQSINQYLDFHYGQTEYFGVKNFPLRCAQKIIDTAKAENIKGRALDLGCSVGRSTIQLAHYFDQVVGLEYSLGFVNAAKKVLETKYADFANKVKFMQGDACKLDKNLGKFDTIFGGNLIDRLYDPQQFLIHIHQFMSQKSILVLTSPYTWLEQFTKKQKWLGGRQINGKNVSTYQRLREILTGLGLKEVRDPEDVRFVIQENPWVYQYTNAHMTFWGRGVGGGK